MFRIQGEELMDWKEFFRLTVLRETLEGSHLYFKEELKVPTQFSMDELLLKEFEYLDLSEQEKKSFSLNLRKIFLRHQYFNSLEFERISENFISRVAREKDQFMTFSTYGGGIYLFIALLRRSQSILKEKKLICYTSELPLDVLRIDELTQPQIHFILRPHAPSFLRPLPTLWQNTHLIDLFMTTKA